ncbi:MAG: hypothetical protein KKE20_00700 [Nanoarchaeota archaeon]|nr:hypothetical protein [Nanoarchaeota archaeon]
MKSKEVILVISVMFIMLMSLGFVYISSMSIESLRSTEPPCDFSAPFDLLDFALFKVLIIFIPVLFVIGSADFLLSKKLFKSSSIFLTVFLSLIFIHMFFILVAGNRSHCTLNPTPEYMESHVSDIENQLKIMILNGNQADRITFKTINSRLIDKICFSEPDSLVIFYGLDSVRESQTEVFALGQESKCALPVDSKFSLKFQGTGNITRIVFS